ncbi:hypothetical protein LCGC14_1136630 [marine sediment metagenome]|uniref:Uncharacterized protein n=1 Tax=marine sediment metagenome TaxID=412755 RepID=A0A0F9Q580_9ZZZZ
MFDKGDVYTIEGDAVRWVGVVTEYDEFGGIRAIEVAYNKQNGWLVGVSANIYFNVDRPGQRVLLVPLDRGKSIA